MSKMRPVIQPDDTLERMLLINRLLSSLRLRFATEAQLQADVAIALRLTTFVREYRLGDGRIDFLCAGGIGIECKTKGSPAVVLRQLIRYADFEEINGLLLVTSRSTHRFSDTELRGKPFRVVWVGVGGVL